MIKTSAILTHCVKLAAVSVPDQEQDYHNIRKTLASLPSRIRYPAAYSLVQRRSPNLGLDAAGAAEVADELGRGGFNMHTYLQATPFERRRMSPGTSALGHLGIGLGLNFANAVGVTPATIRAIGSGFANASKRLAAVNRDPAVQKAEEHLRRTLHTKASNPDPQAMLSVSELPRYR